MSRADLVWLAVRVAILVIVLVAAAILLHLALGAIGVTLLTGSA